MNKKLLQEIIRHIFFNFAITSPELINFKKVKSLKSSEFFLEKKQIYDDNDNNLWGCQISYESNEFKILLMDCSQDKDINEYALLISIKNSPTYGLYIIDSDQVDDEPLIACSINNKDWMECNTYLQATFLAGMEQIKDLGFDWTKIKDYDKNYECLLSFINFHNNVYEVINEGQEERQ